MITETPTWFGPTERPLFGWMVHPEDCLVRGSVVICPPICEEGRATHRTMRDLAARFAEMGFLAVRFDYDGTGDSAGGFNDPAGLDRWVASVDEAVKLARGICSGPVSLVGMRMGATIGAVAAARASWRPQSVVLWDPCESGVKFLREQSLLHRSTRDVVQPDDGSIETPGYVFGPDAARALAALRIEEALELGKSETAAAVLFRDDRPVPEPLKVKLTSAGFSVGPASGQDLLLDVPPLDAVVPSATLERVVRMVASACSDERRLIEPVSRTGVTIATPSGDVCEALVQVGPNRLFGIRTTPVGSAPPVTAVFFNVATESHVGPARMWTDLSRTWVATLGICGLRFDLSGIGDSPHIAGSPRDMAYSPRWIDDTADVVAELTEDGFASVVLVGLCSGAYTALEGALHNDVAGVIAINPILSSAEMNKASSTADVRRRAFRPLPVPLARLAASHGRTAWSIWTAYQQIRPHASPMAVIADVLKRGPIVMLALAEVDRPPFDAVWYWRLRSRSLDRTGRFTRVDLENVDHPALVAAGRLRLMTALTQHVADTYAQHELKREHNRVSEG